jgi:hypothetical protein
MNVLMIIFLELDQKVAIERVCYQFDQNVYSVLTYDIYDMKTDRIKLMEFLMENS